GQDGFGIPSWEAKLEVEDHMRRRGLPFTSLRPQALMELMTDKSYYPAVGTWKIWPQMSGEDRPIAWMAAEDVGAIASIVFSQPDDYIGQNLLLVSDVRSLAECRAIYRELIGRAPRTFPMPIWLFDRFTKKDVTAIWRWVRTGTYPTDTAATRAIHPSALTVREWLGRVRDRQLGATKTEKGRVEHG
ncbi:MAG: NmrA family NAD(P)-binding protein, partial [Acidimicrobiia bacterium]